MPLSWSVCRVCSRRPSLPKHSQLNGTPGSPFSARVRLDHPAHGVVVEQGDDVSDLGGRRAVGEHRSTSWPISPRNCHQVLHPGRIADGAGQVHQIDPLQGKQIAFGYHATQALVLDQAHMGDMPFGHGDGGVECAVVRGQEKRRLGHVTVDRLGEIAGAVGDHSAQVAQGKNARGRLMDVDDHNAADLLLVHQRARLRAAACPGCTLPGGAWPIGPDGY